MTLTEYFGLREDWLRDHRHPKTVNETRVAVEAFCEWLGSDPDIDSVTPKLIEEWEADKSHRRRQLVSNLYSLLRLYDPVGFPRKCKTMFAQAMLRRETLVAEAPKRGGKVCTLSELAARYVSQRSISRNYSNTILNRAKRYEEFHGTTNIAELFTDDMLNMFLAALEGTGSTWTLYKWRTDLLTLWSTAADDDLCDYPRPRRIRKVKREPVSVECFTVDEVRLLVEAAERLTGCFDNGVARRHYWAAVVRFAYDTGLRRGDCWRFERDGLQPDGTFRITQHKTKKPIRRILRPATVAAIDKIDSPTPLAYPQRQDNFSYQFQRIITAAGVDRGSFKWLRRAAGSHVEAVHPGAGHKVLGNTVQMFNAHYDAQISTQVYAPPEL